jgi:hypothetical protein
MLERAEELGGTQSIRRSRSGGVLLRLAIPLPLPRSREPGSGQPTEGRGGDA